MLRPETRLVSLAVAPRNVLCTYLREDVIHGFTGFLISLPEYPEEPEDLDLQERICDTGDIMFWAVPRGDK